MEEESEKEKKPWKCLGGSNGFFIYRNMAENWYGSSPEWVESTIRMAQKSYAVLTCYCLLVQS